jgi:hypothetical protein
LEQHLAGRWINIADDRPPDTCSHPAEELHHSPNPEVREPMGSA